MPRSLWLEGAVLFFAFFVVAPFIAFLIDRAAWAGKPKNWDRAMYWTAFVVSIFSSAFLMVFAQRMHVDLRSWQHAAEVALFLLGVLLFGVAGGFFVGIFFYGRGKGPIWRGVTSSSNDETDKPTTDQ